MDAKKLSVVVKISVIAMAVCGILMCALWLPYSTYISVVGAGAQPTAEQNVAVWVQVAFYCAACVPCFVILAFVWKIADAIKGDRAFSAEVAKLIMRAAVTLYADIAFFMVGNIVFAALGWNEFFFVYFVVAVIAVVVASIFCVIAHYVSKAAYLQKETEGLI